MKQSSYTVTATTTREFELMVELERANAYLFQYRLLAVIELLILVYVFFRYL